MRIELNVKYWTNWGESLVVCIAGKKFPMNWSEDGLWSLVLEDLNSEDLSDYHYEVEKDGLTVKKEWRSHRVPSVKASAKAITVNDCWSDRPSDSPFYSSAFTDGIFSRAVSKAKKAAASSNVVITVDAAQVRPGETLCICGSNESLGNWTTPVQLSDCNFPNWSISLKAEAPFFYKFVKVETATGRIVAWEDGENRFFGTIPPKGEVVVEAVKPAVFSTLGWKGAGTAIPVFSLRSEDDFGVGEFFDLKKMVDWAAASRQSIIQILPINDTTMTWTWQDSYPYNANSIFALHPQFINLKAAGVSADASYKALQKELNSLEVIDYERVNKVKIDLLRKAFAKTFAKVSKRQDYIDFVRENEFWLRPYAAFCTLRDINGTPDFSKWKGYSKYSEKKIDKLISEHPDDMDFWFFVQYHLDAQLSQVCSYARSHGVVLKGDLPIGISRTSVDAWVHPELFHLDSQAGAPPDAFAEDGQNWGFPTYNWEKMAEDGFSWWKSRLSVMSRYFDAFRIDHILGFFRIWEIPVPSKSGLDGYFNPALPYPAGEVVSMGFDPHDGGLFIEDPRKKDHFHPRIGARKSTSYACMDPYRKSAFDRMYDDFFYHRHNEFWKDSAMKKLPALMDSTGMLACGEDLGMIPATVPQVMEALRILSLEIQRMPKSVHDTFANPAYYPYLSVCTTSTHDMNPIRAWWEEDRALTQKFYNEMLHCGGQAPYFCEPWVCEKIVRQHLDSPAMLVVLPLQDWLSMDGNIRRENPNDERINVPANPRHYWRYRMHLTLEQLLASDEFNASLTEMIQSSGRSR